MIERRCAAILAADVVGYTALMQADEEWTFRRLTGAMEEAFALVHAHGGEVVSRAGDGILCVLPNSLAALRAGLDMQLRMAEAARGEQEDRRLLFRIGLNAGEFLVSGTDVFGSVVNVAARLQNLAPPGGVLISGAVHEAVRGVVACGFEDLGGLEVRGLEQRVRCFRVIGDDCAKPRPHPPLPARPSLAVLPFANLSGNPEHDFFADGIAEDVINALSQVRSFFVIARSSSFTYRGRAVPVSQVGRELGVRYVLEGTVRRAADHLRITGSLVEAETGHQLWAGRFDGSIGEVFELQDRVTESVVAAIEPRLLFAEVERATRAPPESIQAYDLFLRATGHFYRMTRDDIERAKELTDRALRLDPDSARNLALGARCRLHRKVQGWVPPTHPSIAEGARMGRRAAELAKDDPEVLWMAGITVALAGGDVAGGVALIDRSLRLNPNSADALTYSGMARAYLGEADVALAHLERAHRLSPLDAQTYNKFLAAAFATFAAGRYEESLGWSSRALNEKADYVPAWRIRAACFGLLDRAEEGREAVLRLLALSPKETQASLRIYYGVSFKAAGAVDRLVAGLARSGLPEAESERPPPPRWTRDETNLPEAAVSSYRQGP
ncbi:adenylate/guanylate cyclase domain-containing protein [Paracraurococcus lichenis]|uniref:Adenylate/guanylate cyclase domain-containing protein n=1 Tax=Paracraurococcus lichenis TaxID=3064888 RepID=A0ABT9DWX6_9PROT|nr:adenylate/guanylate cyclase domain-containing protein [Paracraurococcus sp. LOR1-02]MDO9708404.1 adenylate/guanylate cyclase domain-containing protein [Paracraurococcus sp. LOR1-02]